MIETHLVSLDNTGLHLVHNNRAGRPAIIFIHGACSSHRAWIYQLGSKLLNEHFHLIALDMRGHGRSDKPTDPLAYQDGQRWADDLAVIFHSLKLECATLVAWSYGGRMISDYIRAYGEARINGINFIAAGTLARDDVKGPGYQVLADLFSDEPDRIREAEKQFVSDLTEGIDDATLKGYMSEDLAACPKYVRDAMRQRTMDYDDLLAELQRPVLLTHGEDDSYSLVKLAYLLNEHIPHTTLSVFEQTGHMPFAQCPQAYNQALFGFVTALNA
ncbi:alpha/beta fold hydrolase [Alteromonas sp. CYL-A6]|uniref:alpha/beta fold hydrolase n=1 Tax=Alteromonas nitratireducens TaxID=3390813 RepID=UPI0034C172D6